MTNRPPRLAKHGATARDAVGRPRPRRRSSLGLALACAALLPSCGTVGAVPNQGPAPELAAAASAAAGVGPSASIGAGPAAPPAGPGPTAPASSVPAGSPSAAPISSAELDAWIRRYHAGQEVIRTADPSVVFVAPDRAASCTPLPAERPEQFEGYHFASDGELRQEPWHGFAASECHFEWGLLHLDRPRARCTRLAPSAMDYLYGELRRLQIWTIRMRDAKGANPDRPGWGVTIRWPGHRCSFHAWGEGEASPDSSVRFFELVDLLERIRTAGQSAQNAQP